MSDDRRAQSGPASEEYYHEHGLDDDRIALWFYARVARRLCRRGGRVLDFGCGTGHLLRRLSRRFEAYGYDASPHARNRCRMVAAEAVVLEDWRTLEANSVDLIVALHTLEHIEHPAGLVGELAVRLKPGGVLLFVVPNPGGLGHRLKRKRWFAYRDPTHWSLLSQGEWVMVARRAGLRVDWVHGDGMWDPPYVGWLPESVQRYLFGAPAALQLALPLRPFLPPALGECLIVAARKPADEHGG